MRETECPSPAHLVNDHGLLLSRWDARPQVEPADELRRQRGLVEAHRLAHDEHRERVRTDG